MEAGARSRAEALRDLGRRAAEIAEQRVPGAPAVVESLEREQAAGSGLLAGGVAYRIFLWLVPFGLVLAAIASFWTDANPDGIEEAAKELGMAGITAHTAQTAFQTGELAVCCAAALAAMELLPHADVRWTALLPGVAVVGIGMQLMHVIVVVYFVPKLGRSSELYGSLGISTVVLLWLYLTARLIVSAAFLNATLWDRSIRA